MKPREEKECSFEEVERHWYERLKDSGFEDIEETSLRDRPLKEWHSFKFLSKKSQERQKVMAEYQRQLESFLNDRLFPDACESVARHGNSRLTAESACRIFQLHAEGCTERSIAKELRLSKSSVHATLEKMKKWMTLL